MYNALFLLSMFGPDLLHSPVLVTRAAPCGRCCVLRLFSTLVSSEVPKGLTVIIPDDTYYCRWSTGRRGTNALCAFLQHAYPPPAPPPLVGENPTCSVPPL
ncbi:unnamed protein product [Laminaria digitata]